MEYSIINEEDNINTGDTGFSKKLKRCEEINTWFRSTNDVLEPKSKKQRKYHNNSVKEISLWFEPYKETKYVENQQNISIPVRTCFY